MPTKQETLDKKQARRMKEIQVELANPQGCEISDEHCWGDVTRVPYYGDSIYFCKEHRRP